MSVLSLLSRQQQDHLGIDLAHPTVSLYFMRRSEKPDVVLGEWWPSYRTDNGRPLCPGRIRIREPFSSSTPLDKTFTIVSTKSDDVRLLCNDEPHPWFDVARIMAEDYRAAQWPELLVRLVDELPSQAQFTAAVTEAYDRHLQLLYQRRRLDLMVHGAVHGAATCMRTCRTRRCDVIAPAPENNDVAAVAFNCTVSCDTPLAPIGYRILSEASGSVLRKVARPHIKAFVNRLVDDAAVITTALLTPHA